MKKIFFSFLAVAAIASCAKTEAVYNEMDSEIKLAPVAAKQTKANVFGAIDGTVYPTDENFDVYGYWKKDGAGAYTDGTPFFGETGVEFVNRGNYWGGATPYYWPKNGTLRFAAYSPSDLNLAHSQEGDTFTVEGYTQPNETDKTFDFLVAPTSKPYTAMTAAENVSVVFEHALSWITLKVKAKDATANEVFTIKNVTINDVNTKADFNAVMLDAEGQTKGMIDYEAWSNQAVKANYAVFEGEQVVTTSAGVIETNAAGTVIIPQETTTVTITFDQKGVNGTIDTPNMELTLSLVLDKDDEPWRPGYHYTYTILFGLDEILINPSVEDWEEYNVGELDPEATNVSTAAQLKAALADESVTKITLQKNIAGQFDVNEVAGRTLTINGNGKKFDGTFNIVGNSSYTNSNTVFENINFETADASALTGDAFIYCNEQNGNTRYPDNVTIKNCTFTAIDGAEYAAVGAKFRSLNGTVSIEGTSANGMHSLLQMLSSGEAEVAANNVNIENCKNGISLQYTSATIKNSTIVTKEYGIRGENANATLKVVKSTIEAEKPIIVRKLTSATYNVVLDEATLIPGQDYAVVFTNASDDQDFVEPTGKYTITGADDYIVFPANVSTGTVAADFVDAMLNPEIRVIEASEDYDGSNNDPLWLENRGELYLDMNGYEWNGNEAGGYAGIIANDTQLTIDNTNVTGGGFQVAYEGAELTFNSGSIDITSPNSSQRYCFYAAAGGVVTVNGGTFTFDTNRQRSYFCAVNNGTIYVTGGTYGKAPNHPRWKTPVYVDGGKVIITGGTFGFDPSEWVADGYKAVESNGTWTVSAE